MSNLGLVVSQILHTLIGKPLKVITGFDTLNVIPPFHATLSEKQTRA